MVSHSETFCTLCFYCDGVITTVVFFQCHSLSAKYESYCFDYFDERGIFRKSYANIMGTQGCPETLTMLCMYTNESLTYANNIQGLTNTNHKTDRLLALVWEQPATAATHGTEKTLGTRQDGDLLKKKKKLD